MLLFCSDPLSARQPDADYAAEWKAARLAGFQTALIDFEALNAEDAPAAVARVAAVAQPLPALYRGWMLPSRRYRLLYQALAAKNIVLITDPDAYMLTHELPGWYPLLADQTPRSVWLPWQGRLDIAAIMQLLEQFGDRPLILKDYVKSRKHEWFEACFIPAASDAAAVERVTRRFLEGVEPSGGLVYREYVALQPIGSHPRSGMPLTEEYRLFFFDAAPIAAVAYWDEQTGHSIELPLDRFSLVAAGIPSRFFTMDVARRSDGDWTIVELGDGQVAGLPQQTNIVAFYRSLSHACGMAGA